MNIDELKKIMEAVIMASDEPISIEHLMALFGTDDYQPKKIELEEAIIQLKSEYEHRGFELTKVSSGYRFQVKSDMSYWVSKLWLEKPKKYTRAMLETLAIIAYRQPITRGDIEDIRGVSVSSNIIKSLFEREWIRAIGHRDVPGKPTLYATTKQFLDYFNLEKLADLPDLGDLKDINALAPELDFEQDSQESTTTEANISQSNTGESMTNNTSIADSINQQLDNDNEN